jgi:hypothetical protein
LAPALKHVHAYALLLAIVAAGFWRMDDLTAPPPVAAPPSGAASDADPAPDHPGSRRMFLLMVDSLRYETAIDPHHMPHLQALRARSACAKVKTTHDAVTVPALRAAFTGEDRISVFGFVRNLWHSDEGVGSLFTPLAGRGDRVGVWSDGSFRQFGPDLAAQHFNRSGEGTEEERQNRAVGEALQAFLAGSFDVVIAHIVYSDSVPHVYGIHHEEYHRMARAVDDLVRRLDQAIPPQESFVVMGDHGHDEVGRHMMGLDVPTFALFRGPAYQPGADLGHIAITDIRYLVSFALKLPLPGSYRAGRHPQALVPGAALPEPYARAVDALAERERQATGVPREARWAYASLVLTLSAMAALWLALLRGAGPRRLRLLVGVSVWPVLALVAFPGLIGGATLLPPVACAVMVAALLAARPGPAETAWLLVPVAAGVGMERWGHLLSLIRPVVHYPSYEILVGCWVLFFGGLAWLAWRRGAMLAGWVAVGAGAFLLYPSVYRYGSPASMAPAWLAWLALVCVEPLRRRTSAAPPGPGPLLRLGAIAVLVAPFLLVNSVHFEFSSWVGPLPDLLWGGVRAATPPWPGLALAFLAKLVIFGRPGSTAARRLCGALIAAALAAVQCTWSRTAPGIDTAWWYAAAIGATGAAAAWTWRRSSAGSPADRWPSLVLLLCLYIVCLYSIRVPLASILWGDCLLAAIVLSARFVGRSAVPAPQAALLLLLIGVVATGWFTLAWTFHRFEWGFLYDWFEASFVEWNVAAFLLPIILRYALPILMLRLLLAAEPPGRPASGAALAVAGLKALSVVLVACGMGLHRVDSNVYLEAVQQATIWAWLAAGLIGRRGAAAPPPRT